MWPLMLTLLRGLLRNDTWSVKACLNVTKNYIFSTKAFELWSIFVIKKAPHLAVNIMLAANMASKVCIKYTALWKPNAARGAIFRKYQRKKKFTNCSLTSGSSWIVCATLTREAAKRLKHCNNASKLRNCRFKVTIEYSFFSSPCPYTPNADLCRGFGLLCECFPHYCTWET